MKLIKTFFHFSAYSLNIVQFWHLRTVIIKYIFIESNMQILFFDFSLMYSVFNHSEHGFQRLFLLIFSMMVI